MLPFPNLQRYLLDRIRKTSKNTRYNSSSNRRSIRSKDQISFRFKIVLRIDCAYNSVDVVGFQSEFDRVGAPVINGDNKNSKPLSKFGVFLLIMSY